MYKDHIKSIILYLLLVIFLLILAWFSYASPSQNQVRDDLAAGLLGSAITAVAALCVALYAVAKTRQQRTAHYRFLSAQKETARKQSVQLGRMRIKNMFVVTYLSKQRGAIPVRFQFTHFDEGSSRPTSNYADFLKIRIANIQNEAQSRDVLLHDGESVDLVQFRLLESYRESKRIVWQVTPRKTTYFDWAATSGRLDTPLTRQEREALSTEADTLREYVDYTPHRIEDIKYLNIPSKIAVGVVVVTIDNLMVLTRRGKTFIAGADKGADRSSSDSRAALHFVAEGALLSDLDSDGFYDPAITALRGIKEELNLNVETDIDGAPQLTAVFFDSQRMQPLFTFVARSRLTFDEINTKIHAAVDFWESDGLLGLPYDAFNPEVTDLLTSEMHEYIFASNHAHALAYAALLYEFGIDNLTRSLSYKKRT